MLVVAVSLCSDIAWKHSFDYVLHLGNYIYEKVVNAPDGDSHEIVCARKLHAMKLRERYCTVPQWGRPANSPQWIPIYTVLVGLSTTEASNCQLNWHDWQDGPKTADDHWAVDTCYPHYTSGVGSETVVRTTMDTNTAAEISKMLTFLAHVGSMSTG